MWLAKYVKRVFNVAAHKLAKDVLCRETDLIDLEFVLKCIKDSVLYDATNAV